MVLLVAGVFLLALGWFAGLAMVLIALGKLSGPASLALWILFPALTIAGSVLFGIGGKLGQIRSIVLGSALSMLLLAGVAAVSLVMSAAGMLTLPGGSVSLWYVFLVAGAMGAIAAAAVSRDE
ncbi:hypothetical protein QWZ03_03330 [Chitinimonas viridis]|uniref:Major facilitator superfamily (MFS) profile domain-containing protein n=1 Tax=Chitinimonas viridis TaxID=664880 RepID=A0ABT8B2A6_9NEIS|nr:hypothetical protein [Chitinimonas viridis]MDN3575801.1 hypothetical protein [Chitinimonas viridis]